MSNIGNKEVMSSNLKYYIEKSGKDRRELAEIWGFPYSTVTEWINGKKYPRIDRIEVMADYFGILKSDLIEKKTEEHKKIQEKNSALADATIRMRNDNEFFSIVEGLSRLDAVQLASVKQIVDAFLKD
jgi:transcriptional regulator with XRE-family HTH domain